MAQQSKVDMTAIHKMKTRGKISWQTSKAINKGEYSKEQIYEALDFYRIPEVLAAGGSDDEVRAAFPENVFAQDLALALRSSIKPDAINENLDLLLISTEDSLSQAKNIARAIEKVFKQALDKPESANWSFDDLKYRLSADWVPMDIFLLLAEHQLRVARTAEEFEEALNLGTGELDAWAQDRRLTLLKENVFRLIQMEGGSETLIRLVERNGDKDHSYVRKAIIDRIKGSGSCVELLESLRSL